MTYPTLSLTESQTLTALRSFLLSILPSGIEVVKGQDVRVSEPEGENFVEMTPVMRERQATNVTTYTDGFPSNPSVRGDLQSTRVTVQLDVHGPASADNTQLITTLFRSDYGVSQFATSGFDVQPLYNSEPRQIPFLNGEQQIEYRWSVDAVMQCNPIVTNTQQFASQLSVAETIAADINA